MRPAQKKTGPEQPQGAVPDAEPGSRYMFADKVTGISNNVVRSVTAASARRSEAKRRRVPSWGPAKLLTLISFQSHRPETIFG